MKSEEDNLRLLQEYRYLTAEQMARLRGAERKQCVHIERANLNRLYQKGRVKRFASTNPKQLGSAYWVYFPPREARPRNLDHELAISNYHILLKEYCVARGLDLIWQQNHMTGKFWPDAYFSLKGLHFFLEVERQEYGNVKNGQPSILRKADAYYKYYDSQDCMERWKFNRFRIIFQLHEINPDDFLSKLPTHRMFWVGIPNSLSYRAPKGDNFSFSDV